MIVERIISLLRMGGLVKVTERVVCMWTAYTLSMCTLQTMCILE